MMEKMIIKNYLVFDKDNVTDYNLFVQHKDGRTAYSLSTNNSQEWSADFRNKEIISMIDNGDLEYEIKVRGKKVDKITADELDCLRIVLNFAWKKNDKQYKLIENNDPNFIKI